MKKKILQQYFKSQINNGGPATCALLIMNSDLKDKYEFVPMDECYPFKSGFFKQFIYFYKKIKQEKPDLVHIRGVQLEGFWGVLAANLLKVKCVMSVDGLNIDAQNNSRIKDCLLRYIIEPYALKHADMTYCVCRSMQERVFIQSHTKCLHNYIHNAAPLYDLTCRNKDRATKRQQLNVQSNDILLTNIGRLTKEKGIHILMSSFALLVEKYPHIKLCLAGTGSYVDTIRKEYLSLLRTGKLLLLGKISDVKETLLASDIFVFPTLHENLSNSLLEAGSVGLPIIATNVGGNPEVVEQNVSGLLIRENNVDDLTQSLEKLILDSCLRKKLGENIQRKIEIEYSQQVIFDEMGQMYDELLKD